MRKTTILLLCVLLMCTFHLTCNAADNLIELDVDSYGYSRNHKPFTSGSGTQLQNGGYIGYDVDLGEKLVNAVQVIFRTGTESTYTGRIDIRLGSATGEVVGSVDTTKLTNIGWDIYTTVDIYLSRNLSGKQTIFVCSGKGIYSVHNVNLKIIDVSRASMKFASLEGIDCFPDISDDANKTEINLMTALGAISDDNPLFSPKRPVSRIEFASMLGRIIKAEQYSDGVSPFSDVDKDNENVDVLSGLYKLGIIKGDTHGNFRPHDFITVNELSSVCINALGYDFVIDNFAESFNLAKKLKLFNGVDISGGFINRSNSARLLYNLFTAETLEVAGINNDGVIYEKEENYIEKNTEYIHDIGVVTANSDTQLYVPNGDLGNIVINDMEFEVGDTRAADYLGVSCEYFYYEKDGKKILVAIYPERNVDIVIHKSQQGSSFEAISEQEIIYIDGEEDYEYKLSGTTAIIYNGVALDCPLSTIIDADNFVGTITLINNDSDRVYDCVRIDQAKSVVVEGVAPGKIRDLLTGDVIDCTVGTFAVFADGQVGDETVVNIGDVLTIYQSVNKTGEKLTRIIVEKQMINGEITAISYDPKQYLIEGLEYQEAPECISDLYVGLKGDFYLNAYGYIVKYEVNTDTDALLGMFMAADKSGTGFEQNVKLKILTEKDGIVIFEMGGSIVADGVRITEEDDFYNGKNKFCGITSIDVNTPVLYKTDGANRIIMIDTVETGADNENDNLTCLGESGSWLGYNSLLLDKDSVPRHPYKSTTKHIVLTEDEIEENYYIKEGLVFENNERETGVPYSLKKDSMIVDILLSVGNTRILNIIETPFIYTKTVDALNDDGESSKFICGISGSNKNVRYEVNNDSYKGDFKRLMDSLKVGDVVMVGLTNSKVTLLNIAFLPGAKETNNAGFSALLNESTNINSPTRGALYYCNVVSVEDGFIKVEIGDGDYRTFGLSGDAVAFCEEASNGKMEIINSQKPTSLFAGEKVVMYVRERKLLAAYVYRGVFSD